ncbi:MAG: hypothetical protein QOF84_4975 [Streptomyces sp.]|nr:hypothetical protein [Streptomyces sp.]
METDGFIEVLRREGGLLAAAAEKAGGEAEVPPCPGWRVSDLVRHQGIVHRWAAGFVTERRMTAVPIAGESPEDEALLPWFREGHAYLVESLEAAPPDLECWYFLRAPSAREFWARRQAHETTVHRVDAETAQGADLSPIEAELAADGIDELLTGFHRRATSKVRTEAPRTLRVEVVDVPAGRGGDWLVALSPEPPRTERGGGGDADCTVRGRAAELYLALWNRGPYEGLEISGDAAIMDLWRRTAAIV